MAKKLIALVLGIMMLMTVAVSGIAEEKVTCISRMM